MQRNRHTLHKQPQIAAFWNVLLVGLHAETP